VWELIFLMVILKIPIVYLCWVVYWAIKAEPRPDEPETAVVPVVEGPTPPRLPRRRRSRPPRPHGTPSRGYARTRRAGAAYARR
jgi:hypothetical protein